MLRVSYDENFAPPMHGIDMAVRFEGELATRTLHQALLAGLAGLLENPGAEALDDWRLDHSLKSYRDRFDRLRAVGGWRLDEHRASEVPAVPEL